MTEESGFTPSSPLTRPARRRSWLFVQVLIALLVGGALIVLVAPHVSEGQRQAIGLAYGGLLALMFVRQAWLVRRDLRSRRHRDQWFGRMLDRSSLDDG